MPPNTLTRTIDSREYKVMLDSRFFTDPGPALNDLWNDLQKLAENLKLKTSKKGFDENDVKERSIVFLDTPDFTLRLNDLVLRQRTKKNGKVEYTLKCRSEDRYLAADCDLRQAEGINWAEKPDDKFEEDIGVPFVSRFSHSNSVTIDKENDNPPANLLKASNLFPPLRKLERDNLPCDPETRLEPVNYLKIHERVFKGPEIVFGEAGQKRRSTIAMILWNRGKNGTILAAEFSFRYDAWREDDPEKKEVVPTEVARSAKRFFESWQQSYWVQPESLTKTQLVYRR